MTKNKIDLKEVFLSLQDELEAKLQTGRSSIRHPGTKGDATELNWHQLLKDYLPQRYSISKAFVVDSKGQCSDQIDIVIHDHQYSPLLFNHAGAIYIPAESVYCVFEVKQEISQKNIIYAGKKAASVRKLIRTSAPFAHTGGLVSKGGVPPRILAGILALDFKSKTKLDTFLKNNLNKLLLIQQLDLGCSIRAGSFDVEYGNAGGLSRCDISKKNTALVFFLMRLIHRLRWMATAPAIDLEKYEKFL